MPMRPRGSLTRRILAVNIIALAMVGGSIFYLDAFRARLIEERRTQQEREIELVATVLSTASAETHPSILRALGQESGNRIRGYDGSGQLKLDTWQLGPRTFRLVDPATENWSRRFARWADAVSDRIVRAAIPPPYVDQGRLPASHWPELVAVMSGQAHIASRVRLAPDRTLVITAATRVGNRPLFLLSGQNATDVTRIVREERFRLGIIVTIALALSAALSLFLARTIVHPLRRLALAATQVRLGRARDVVVPRLPARSDEVGLLARALSDMTVALRERIDAVEAFAGDVTHELKNPLASLSSAVESLQRVEDRDLRSKLLAIVTDDVRRLDRLINDIADVSRIDAQLSRSRFEDVDLGGLIARLLQARRLRDPESAARIRFLPRSVRVQGDEARLARLFENLIENALSFAPPGTLVRMGSGEQDGEAEVWIEDDGPGVAPEAREAIFERFHTDRPDRDDVSQEHSGLGLAIAKAIVQGHNGRIVVESSLSGSGGARFVVRLPLG